MGITVIELPVIGSSRPALLDDDLARLTHYRWRLSSRGFVYRHGDRVVKLSHEVLGQRPPPGFAVTYANGDKFDCQRGNLVILFLEKYLRRPGKRGPQLQTSAEASADLDPQRTLDLA